MLYHLKNLHICSTYGEQRANKISMLLIILKVMCMDVLSRYAIHPIYCLAPNQSGTLVEILYGNPFIADLHAYKRSKKFHLAFNS